MTPAADDDCLGGLPLALFQDENGHWQCAGLEELLCRFLGGPLLPAAAWPAAASDGGAAQTGGSDGGGSAASPAAPHGAQRLASRVSPALCGDGSPSRCAAAAAPSTTSASTATALTEASLGLHNRSGGAPPRQRKRSDDEASLSSWAAMHGMRGSGGRADIATCT